MYERAKYFSNKFIRNGIAGFAISAFIIYNAIAKDKAITSVALLFPIVAVGWLYFGLKIKQKLKAKVATNENEITDTRNSFKQVEYALSILLIASLMLSFRQWEYASYLLTGVLIVYAWWFYTQMQLLNSYFKAEK